jgi:hypothetical protein
MSTVRSRKSAVEPLNPDVVGAHVLNDHAVRADARFAEIDLITDDQMLCAGVLHSRVLPLTGVPRVSAQRGPRIARAAVGQRLQ